MGNGERVQVEDGLHKLRTVRRSTFPSKTYCLLLDIEDRRGLTPFLTDEEVDPECDRVLIDDMELEEVRYENN